jgi:DNA-binding MarR family transcriptional regulator
VTTTAFCHLASEVGSLDYLVLQELRRCLDLKRGGVDHEGEHWVYKSAQELADLLGVARNTAAKALRRLAESGLLAREKLGVAVGHITNRAWYYRLGDAAPEWLRLRQRNGSRRNDAIDCARAAQSNSSSTLRTNHSRATAARTAQTALTEERVQALAAQAPPGAASSLLSSVQEEEWARNPMNSANRERVALGPKAKQTEDRVKEENPEATEEQLEGLMLEEVCRQIQEAEERQEAKAKRLNPLHGALGRAQKRARGI